MWFGLSFMPDPTTVMRMQDRAVVAAVVAGDADGFAAAYDQYAASLYAYCHCVLPEPEAAVRIPAGLAGKVKVAPSGGSLPASGYVDVTVTVTSKGALTTHLIVAPGNLTVTVVYEVKT